MNYLILFLAVFIGYFLALILKVKEVKKLSIYLAFSGAFLLALTIFELLPNVYETPNKLIGVYIIACFFLRYEYRHLVLLLLALYIPPKSKKSP